MPFTTVQFKKFAQSAITTSLVTVYTVPASAQDVVKDFDIANTTGSAIPVTVHFVPSGGVAGVATQVLPNSSIAPNSVLHWTGTQVLNTGDFIQVIAGNTGCNINVSGLENT
jgi:hypothetical protein